MSKHQDRSAFELGGTQVIAGIELVLVTEPGDPDLKLMTRCTRWCITHTWRGWRARDGKDNSTEVCKTLEEAARWIAQRKTPTTTG